MANAFACRSATQWAGAIRWTGNRFLVKALIIELLLLIALLYVRPLAGTLGQNPPNIAGAVMALLAFPAVLVADAFQKRWASSKKPLRL